jgi:hypothetical protein
MRGPRTAGSAGFPAAVIQAAAGHSTRFFSVRPFERQAVEWERFFMPPPFLLVKRIVLAAAVALAFVYAGDSISVRLRLTHPNPTDPLETITAPRVLAIPQKGSKVEYQIDQEQPQQTVVCVHALFPHSGYSPCWYLKKKIKQPIPMTILLPLESAIGQFAVQRGDHPER